MDQSFKLLQTAFDSLDIGFMLIERTDPDDAHSFVVLYCNEAGAASVGLHPEDFVGERIVDAFPNLDRDGLIDLYVQTLAENQSYDVGEISYGDDRVEESVFRTKFVPLAEHLMAITYTNVTEERRAQSLIEKQNKAILEMSTPTIKLWKDILLLPLIGEVDTARGVQMIEHLLHAIVEYEARVAIFDITGVPSVDTQVAKYLMQAVRAARMLGTDVLLTGISPETAMTLIKLGIDIAELNTHRSLHRGIAAAFGLLGFEIVGRDGSDVRDRRTP